MCKVRNKLLAGNVWLVITHWRSCNIGLQTSLAVMFHECLLFKFRKHNKTRYFSSIAWIYFTDRHKRAAKIPQTSVTMWNVTTVWMSVSWKKQKAWALKPRLWFANHRLVWDSRPPATFSNATPKFGRAPHHNLPAASRTSLPSHRRHWLKI